MVRSPVDICLGTRPASTRGRFSRAHAREGRPALDYGGRRTTRGSSLARSLTRPGFSHEPSRHAQALGVIQEFGRYCRSNETSSNYKSEGRSSSGLSASALLSTAAQERQSPEVRVNQKPPCQSSKCSVNGCRRQVQLDRRLGLSDGTVCELAAISISRGQANR
jgi:hypothetical protein